MAPKLILERLPLEPNDVLVVTVSEAMSDENLETLARKFEETVKPRLLHKNLIIIIPFDMTIQALRPLVGKIKIVNERLTMFTEENL